MQIKGYIGSLLVVKAPLHCTRGIDLNVEKYGRYDEMKLENDELIIPLAVITDDIVLILSSQGLLYTWPSEICYFTKLLMHS